MMERFLEWWSDRLQGRLIVIDGEPYMERYFLADIDWTFFKWRFRRAVYLHCILKGDSHRGLHNHPWAPAFSIILSGYYRELKLSRSIYENTLRQGDIIYFRTPVKYILRTVRFFNSLGRGVFHRILMDSSTSARVWTLFIRGPITFAGWGFVYPDDKDVQDDSMHGGYERLRYRQYHPATEDAPDARVVAPGYRVKSHRT